ncbi:MAG TPA: hypothetical protein PK507_02375 [bacterium]|nr:hypothetical protein [bacterium]
MFYTVKFNQLTINFDALAIPNKEKNKECKPIVEYLDSTKAPFKKRTFENYIAFNNSALKSKYNEIQLPIKELVANFENKKGKILNMYKSEMRNKIHSSDAMDFSLMRFKDDLKRYFNLSNINVIFDKDAKNLFDIYFDCVKPYGEEKYFELAFDVEKRTFTQPENLMMSIFINGDIFLSLMGEDDYYEILSSEFRKSFVFSLIKDSIRIKRMEQMNLLLFILKDINSVLDLITIRETYSETGNEKIKSLASMYYKKFEEYKFGVDVINGIEEISKYIGIFSFRDSNINPIQLLGLIEPTYIEINQIMKSVLGDKIFPGCSSYDLMNSFDSKDVDQLRKSILSIRLIPITLYNAYYIQNGERYFAVNNTLEQLFKVSYESYSTNKTINNSFSSIMRLLNTKYYVEIVETFKNPLNTKEYYKSAINTIYEEYKKSLGGKE